MTISEFTNRLKDDGYYIGEDGHIYSPKGAKLSRLCRNGYYLARKMYERKVYHFMEHRVIWCWYYGDIDDNLVINHKDFDRSNNRIENLELITQSENVRYTIEAGRVHHLKGAESPRAYMTDDDVKLIRYLVKNGYRQNEVAKLYDLKNVNLISRVVTGARYGDVQDADSVISIYPLLIEKTKNKSLSDDELLKNAVMGLSGETGEVVDQVKKYFYHGHDLDVNHLIEELGDILYYITTIANIFEIDISDIMFQNEDKLNSRYPDGFSEAASINRKE